MGKRESPDNVESGDGPRPEVSSEEPRGSQRESQEETAPLRTAGYANDTEPGPDSRRAQTSTGEDEEEPLDSASALSGRLNPVGGGE